MIDHYKQRFAVAAVTAQRRVKKERSSASAIRGERRNAAWRAGRPAWHSASPFGREGQSSALPTRRRPENEGDHHLCQEGRSDPREPGYTFEYLYAKSLVSPDVYVRNSRSQQATLRRVIL